MATIEEIMTEIPALFRTFGAGQTSEYNSLTNALSDGPLVFAAGVDVRKVVEFVAAKIREES